MKLNELKLEDLNPKIFIKEKIEEISNIVKDGLAINALSGGVDSATVTLLANNALGGKLKTYFIDNGLMREGEPEYVINLFKKLDIDVKLINAQDVFFNRLKGVSDPEEKRESITQAFYKDVFGKLVKNSGAKYLFHGTNYTDVEETIAGVKRQHNILEQLGIDTETEFGYKVLEPLVTLRKTGVRLIGKHLGLPKEIYERPPFPGPALATRVIGEVTPKKIDTVRKATKIVEEELVNSKAFQYLAILHNDKVTGMRNGKRDYGMQIEVRCWDSKDAVIGSPTKLPFTILNKLAYRIVSEVNGVVSVTYNITEKPPSTIEAV